MAAQRTAELHKEDEKATDADCTGSDIPKPPAQAGKSNNHTSNSETGPPNTTG